MNVDLLQGLAPLAVGVIALLAEGIRRSRGQSERDLIEQDLRILAALGEAGGRAELEASLADRIRTVATGGAKRRDPFGAALGISFLVIAAVCGWQAAGGLWWLWFAVLIFGLLGVVGTVDGFTKAHRDGKGRRYTAETTANGDQKASS